MRRFYLPLNQLLNEPNALSNLLLPHVSRLLVLLTLPFSSYLPEGLSCHGVKPLLANSGLKEIPALGELMLPPCGLRPSSGFIQCPKSGGFVLLKVFQYQSMGVAYSHR
jgi:hypothetical protein